MESDKRKEVEESGDGEEKCIATAVAVAEAAAEKGSEEGGDPTDDIMIDIDSDDLLFSDDAFATLPDFPCLSSPSASPPSMSSVSTVPKNPCISTPSSSSSSSSSWSFLAVPGGSGDGTTDMQTGLSSAPSDLNQMVPDGNMMDILGDIQLFDPNEPWDASSLFLQEDESTLQHQIISQDQELESEEGGGGGGGGDGCSPDLAKVFFEWLKSNKDSISPEDLRSIKLKRSTIECAAARLGGGERGRMKLLKLILAWVQNHHLQKKQHQQQQLQQQLQQQQPPAAYRLNNPNPNPNLEYRYGRTADQLNFGQCNPWIHYPPDPMAPAVPSMNPYHYNQSSGGGGGTSSIVVNSQPFSASPDFHAFPSTPMHYSPPFSGGPPMPHLPAIPVPVPVPPQYPGGNYGTGQYQGPPLYPQGPSFAGMASSATREARKKRMARQRRFSTLHTHRSQNHHRLHGNHHHAHSATQADQSNLGSTSTCASPSQLSPNSNVSAMQKSPPSPPPLQKQGGKTDKNMRFLLQKVLKQSDVGSLGRIVLPKKEAEIHLPELDARDGISILMEDIGTSRVWNMRYRFWPNNKSRMYLLENTGDFVRCNGLQEGDFIVIYSDVKSSKYMIRGVKVRQPAEAKGGGGSRNAAGKAHQKKNSSSQTKTVSDDVDVDDSDKKDESSCNVGEVGDESLSPTNIDIC